MRFERAPSSAAKPLWLLTYADLVTLLMTFFVLILSMSSLDSWIISKISLGGVKELAAKQEESAGDDSLTDRYGKKTGERVSAALALMHNKGSVAKNEAQMRELLFPAEELPSILLQADGKDSLRIFESGEGIAIVMSGGLLFKEGAYALSADVEKLLNALHPVIQASNMNVNVSGHTTPQPESGGIDNMQLSTLRAVAVLEYLIKNDISPFRFSVSAYGGDRPRFDNATNTGRKNNRRVEILLNPGDDLTQTARAKAPASSPYGRSARPKPPKDEPAIKLER